MGFWNWSSPAALNCRVALGLTDAAAGATWIVVRTGGTAVTVTCAVPLIPPPTAEIVKGPPADPPAVNFPVASTVPPPLVVQLKPGWGLRAWPNWSRPEAANCWDPPATTLTLAGVTATELGVCWTVTPVLELMARAEELVMLQVSV